MDIIKKIALVLLVMLFWSAFIALGFIEGFLLKPITSSQSSKAFVSASKKIIGQQYVGNLAMAVIENGEIAATYFHSSHKEKIDTNSAFPVASISKWVTAFGILRLVDQGKIDLDKPVDDYLTRWHLPPSDFDNTQVTVRRLLSHSAGLVDDLGYNGFEKNEEIQTLEASLDQAADGPYSDGRARVGYEPASQFMYSGASYTLLQLLIEEITGQSFLEYMSANVLSPLGMKNSSYSLSDSSRIGLVSVFRTDSTARPMNRFTAKAAASLITSVADLSKFMLVHVQKSEHLSADLLQDMSTPASFRNGVPYYGLGPKLYSQNQKTSHVIGHDGSGNNAINSAARIDLKTNSGIIVIETGNWDIASSVADEWLFWKGGIADYVVMNRNKPYLLTILISGYGVIVLFCVFLFRHKRAPAKPRYK